MVRAGALCLVLMCWGACDKPARPGPAAEPAAAKPDLPATSEALEAEGRPTSLDALIERGVAAIKAKDTDRYAALMANIELATEYCPDMARDMGARIAKQDAKNRADLRAELVEGACAKLDWSAAKEVRREGGAKGDEVRGCPGMYQHSDIELVFEVAGNKVRVKLDDPFLFEPKGTWGFGDTPRCDLDVIGKDPGYVALATRYADEVCAAGDAESAKALVQEYAVAAARLAKTGAPPDPEDVKTLTALSERMMGCFNAKK